MVRRWLEGGGVVGWKCWGGGGKVAEEFGAPRGVVGAPLPGRVQPVIHLRQGLLAIWMFRGWIDGSSKRGRLGIEVLINTWPQSTPQSRVIIMAWKVGR